MSFSAPAFSGRTGQAGFGRGDTIPTGDSAYAGQQDPGAASQWLLQQPWFQQALQQWGIGTKQGQYFTPDQSNAITRAARQSGVNIDDHYIATPQGFKEDNVSPWPYVLAGAGLATGGVLSGIGAGVGAGAGGAVSGIDYGIGATVPELGAATGGSVAGATGAGLTAGGLLPSETIAPTMGTLAPGVASSGAVGSALSGSGVTGSILKGLLGSNDTGSLLKDLILPGAGAFLSGLGESLFQQHRKSFEGTDADPTKVIPQIGSGLQGFMGQLQNTRDQGVSLPDAYVQTPPTMTGGGMAMPVGVTGRDPMQGSGMQGGGITRRDATSTQGMSTQDDRMRALNALKVLGG